MSRESGGGHDGFCSRFRPRPRRASSRVQYHRVRAHGIIILLTSVVGFAACSPAPATRDDTAVLRAVLEPACVEAKIPPTVISTAVANREYYSLPAAWSGRGRYWSNLWLRPSNTAPWQPGPFCTS